MKPANSESQATRPRVFGVSRNVFFLGWVSFLTDVSSEMIFNMLPLFLLNVLGVGTAVIGLIEGLGDSAATILKVVSGWLSDRLGRRKGLTTLGYALSTIAKPFLLVASAWGRCSLYASAIERAKVFAPHLAMPCLPTPPPPRRWGGASAFTALWTPLAPSWASPAP